MVLKWIYYSGPTNDTRKGRAHAFENGDRSKAICHLKAAISEEICWRDAKPTDVRCQTCQRKERGYASA